MQFEYGAPMLRHILHAAMTAIDGEGVHKYIRNHRQEWGKAVAWCGLIVMSRRIEGPHVDYVARAARQIDQRGEIDWDEPETQDQADDERAFLEQYPTAEMLAERHDQARATKQKEMADKKRIIVLTEAQRNKISKPDYRPNVGKRIGDTINYADRNFPDRDFRMADLGIYWGGEMATAGIVNSLIRHGAVTVVGENETASYCTLTRSINWNKLKEIYQEQIEKTRREELENKPQYEWKTDLDTYDFEALPGKGVPILILAIHKETGERREVMVRVPYGYTSVAYDKAKEELGSSGEWEFGAVEKINDKNRY